MVISDLEKLDTYGSYPEAVDDHHWVKIFRQIKSEGYYVLTACKNCGLLARQINSPRWEHCKPNGQWLLPEQENDDSWNCCPNSLWKQIEL